MQNEECRAERAWWEYLLESVVYNYKTPRRPNSFNGEKILWGNLWDGARCQVPGASERGVSVGMVAGSSERGVMVSRGGHGTWPKTGIGGGFGRRIQGTDIGESAMGGPLLRHDTGDGASAM